MPDAKKYGVQSTYQFEDELRRQSRADKVDIEATVEAIANSPLQPQPAKFYKWLGVEEAPGLVELKLSNNPRRLQMLKNGFIVSYTIREYERVVVMEDLNRHWSYKLPDFQPLLTDDQ